MWTWHAYADLPVYLGVPVIFTRSFWTAAIERAAKSFAGTLAAFLPAAGLGAVPELNWGDMLVLSGYAALASVLLSVASAGVGSAGPSLANEVISPPAVDPGEDGMVASELALIVCAVCLVILVVLALT